MLSKKIDKLTPLICSPSPDDYAMLRNIKDANPELATAFKQKQRTNSDTY